MKIALSFLGFFTKRAVKEDATDMFDLRVQKARQREDRRNSQSAVFRTRSALRAV
ncbi:MAG: hypothetical protein ACEQSU_06935 [Microgenomates group bacterium]